MKACPECHSNKIYRYKKEIDAAGAYGPDLLPKLNSKWFSTAKFQPVVCKTCGFIRFYAAIESREKLDSSEHWELNL
jgi:predicted nucleic-acid-binding Zn-ribbon protein